MRHHQDVMISHGDPGAGGRTVAVVLGPLLETKLHVPTRRRGMVTRARLTEQLVQAESTLTLISAPTGFGKTTLLTEWLADLPDDGPSVAWLSLDTRDNDPTSFWSYVVAALNEAAARDLGTDALALLRSAQAPTGAVVAALVNDLSAGDERIILVLDDFHVINVRDVHDEVALLLEQCPPQLRMVIATRADPPLPLARMRGRGDLAEIRVAHLRFTPDEAAAYLNESMGLTLTADLVAALEDRTEGWIAALQLAALTLQGRDDVAGFIADFAGDDRYIVDYLVEEVLQQQPQHVRTFLLQTSILNRLTGSLCDAVTDQADGTAMLEALDRANLFLVPLDDRRRWYRWHHLFADMLRARLLDEQSGHVSELHARASGWFERHGDRSEAIRHALAGEDFSRAAALMEVAIPAVRKSRDEATLRAWFDELPPDVLRVRPVLAVGLVGVMMAAGEIDRAEDALRDADHWLDGAAGGSSSGSPAMVVVDDEGYRRLPGTVAMYRAAQAQARGDAPTTVRYARCALELSPEDDHLNRAAAAGFLGLASWASGELEAAETAYAECMAGLRRAGHATDVLGSAIALTEIRLAQGRLSEALRTCEQALQRVPEQVGPALRGMADVYAAMSLVHLERNHLQDAKRVLLHSEELGEHNGLPQHRYRSRVAMARVLATEGDLDAALAQFDEADRHYDGSDFFPNTRPIPAQRARVLLARGDLRQALDWAREKRLSADDELSYVREFEHLTLTRLLVARHTEDGSGTSLEDAERLVRRLLPAAEAGGRTGSVIEILVVQALAHRARGNHREAIDDLRRAVALAEPEGFIRPFVEAGPAVAEVLPAVAKQGASRRFVNQLLAAFGTKKPTGHAQQDLIDPLSERELEVLRLLATHLQGPDIARELVVSVNTIRTHTKHIYAKLGVNNRRAAVRQGKQLNLL